MPRTSVTKFLLQSKHDREKPGLVTIDSTIVRSFDLMVLNTLLPKYVLNLESVNTPPPPTTPYLPDYPLTTSSQESVSKVLRFIQVGDSPNGSPSNTFSDVLFVDTETSVLRFLSEPRRRPVSQSSVLLTDLTFVSSHSTSISDDRGDWYTGSLFLRRRMKSEC